MRRYDHVEMNSVFSIQLQGNTRAYGMQADAAQSTLGGSYYYFANVLLL